MHVVTVLCDVNSWKETEKSDKASTVTTQTKKKTARSDDIDDLIGDMA